MTVQPTVRRNEDSMTQQPRRITICFEDAIVKVSPEVAELLVRVTQHCALPIDAPTKVLMLDLATALMMKDAKLNVM